MQQNDSLAGGEKVGWCCKSATGTTSSCTTPSRSSQTVSRISSEQMPSMPCLVVGAAPSYDSGRGCQRMLGS